MTIYVYTGVPGSSKSAHAAAECRRRLNSRSPSPVLGNFELAPNAPVKNRQFYTYIPNDRLNVEDLLDYAEEFFEHHSFRENRICLIIDEAQLLFNSRRWSDKDRLQWLEFFSQSRKTGYCVILIAQNASMIDNQFRMLIEYEVNHRRIVSMGLVGCMLSVASVGRLFLHVEYLFQTHDRIGSSLWLLREPYMRMYDTRKTFERKAPTEK